MSFNGSGTFVLNVGAYPYQPNTLIVSANVNALLNDIANGLSLTVTRDGQMSMTGPLHMANQLIDGIKNLQFGTTTSSPSGTMDGLFLTAAHTIGLAVNGSVVQSWTATGTTFSGGAITAPAFIPNGSTVPVNGIYLPAANTLGFATNTTEWGSVNSTGNWVILAASSGSTFTLPAGAVNPVSLNFGAAGTGFYAPATNQLALAISGTQSILVTGSGVTINAPASAGTALSVSGISGSTGMSVTATGAVYTATFEQASTADSQVRINSPTGFSPVLDLSINAAVKAYVGVSGSAGAYMAGDSTGDMFIRCDSGIIGLSLTGAAAGFKLSGNSVSSVNLDAAGTYYEVGMRDAPPNPQSGNYTLALTDRGKAITQASGSAWTLTIPTHASVAFPQGALISVVISNGGGNITISPAGGVTLAWAGTASTGARVLHSIGQCTLYQIVNDNWVVAGSNLT